MATVSRIVPHLWFSDEAEEAANFYTSVFPNSRLGDIARYGSEGYEIHQMEEGTVMTVEFTIDGQPFVALNGGPLFTFSEAISFMVVCKDQQEVDYYWDKLSAGGDVAAQQCGWLKDRYGLSWQVVPEALHQMLKDNDAEKAQRVMRVMLQMKKIDLNELELAYDGKM